MNPFRLFFRWLDGYEDCPRCDEPLRRTDQIVHRVERIWVCDVCRGILPLTDRTLVAKARAERHAPDPAGPER